MRSIWAQCLHPHWCHLLILRCPVWYRIWAARLTQLHYSSNIINWSFGDCFILFPELALFSVRISSPPPVISKLYLFIFPHSHTLSPKHMIGWNYSWGYCMQQVCFGGHQEYARTSCFWFIFSTVWNIFWNSEVETAPT